MAKQLVTKADFARRCGVTAASVTRFSTGAGRPAMVGDRVDFAHPVAQQYHQAKTGEQPQEPAPGVDSMFEEALGWCRQNDRWTAGSLQKHLRVGWRRAQRIIAQLQAAGHLPPPEPDAPAPAAKSAPPPAPRKHGTGRKSSWQDDSQLIEVPEDIEGLADMTLRELIARFGTGYRFLDWLKALKEIEAVSEKRIKNAQSAGRLVSRQLVEVGVVDPFNSAHVRLMTDGAKAITAAVLAKHKAGIPDQEIEAYVTEVVGSFIRPVKSKVERNLAHVETD